MRLSLRWKGDIPVTWGYCLLMNNQPANLLRLNNKHVEPATLVFTRAFNDYSMLINLVPDNSRRREKMAHRFRFMLRYSMTYHEVYATSPALEGIEVWTPPSANTKMTIWKSIRAGAIATFFRMGWSLWKQMNAIQRSYKAVHKEYEQMRPWILSILAVDLPFQGHGYASILLKPMLDRFDREGICCLLSTQNPRNIAIYEHFGFATVKTIAIAATKTASTFMLRKPRTSGTLKTGIVYEN